MANIELAKQYIKIKNLVRIVIATAKSIMGQSKDMFDMVDPEAQAEISKAFDDFYRQIDETAEYVIAANMIPIISQSFTDAELQQIIIFYESSVGKKLLEFEQDKSESLKEPMQDWMQDLGSKTIIPVLQKWA